VVSELAVREPRLAPAWVALVGVGFCGGFTTMSTFSVETLRLPLPTAAVNVVGTVGLCLGAAWVGMRIARLLPA
jgi:CrcB protein